MNTDISETLISLITTLEGYAAGAAEVNRVLTDIAEQLQTAAGLLSTRVEQASELAHRLAAARAELEKQGRFLN